MNDFAAAVLAWYDQHGRKDLPWQKPATPYRVWISEIMLQQTQVATVIPYFERFLQSFPDVKSLAAAPEDAVLAHWSGLGYYARARNLHRTARRLLAEYGGEFPRDMAQMQNLPGIGRSTAGAILSLAFGAPEAILDGNVKRVLARYHGIDAWPGKAEVGKRLWEIAEAALPDYRPGAYNQAMMDLGATLCSARKPACVLCPLQSACRAFAAGNPENYPGKKPGKSLPIRQACLLVLTDRQGRFLLQRRPPQGRWGGLWSFPEFASAETARSFAHSRFNCDPQRESMLAPFRHTFSHFHFDIQPLQLYCRKATARVLEADSEVWYKSGPRPGGVPKPVERLLQQLLEPERG